MIRNALTAFLNNNVDTFFYLFTYALWTETLLNPDITHETKHDLFELLVDILLNINEKYTNMKLPDNVGFKKSSSKDFVTMMTIEKLERIIPSIIMTILEIERGDIEFGLERFGNHDWYEFDYHPEQVLHATACH